MKRIKLDLSGVNEEGYYDKMKELFGFFDGFGRNPNAVYDCFRYLREPESGMTEIVLSKEERLTLEFVNIEKYRYSILDDLLWAIEAANSYYIARGEAPVFLIEIDAENTCCSVKLLGRLMFSFWVKDWYKESNYIVLRVPFVPKNVLCIRKRLRNIVKTAHSLFNNADRNPKILLELYNPKEIGKNR